MRNQQTLVRLMLLGALTIGGTSAFASGFAPNSAMPVDDSGKKDGDTAKKNMVDVSSVEYKFTPNVLKAEVGVPLTITLHNKGTINHNIHFPTLKLTTKTIAPGKSATVVITPTEAGTLKFECKVPGHNMVGMVGTVEVKAKKK